MPSDYPRIANPFDDARKRLTDLGPWQGTRWAYKDSHEMIVVVGPCVHMPDCAPVVAYVPATDLIAGSVMPRSIALDEFLARFERVPS